MEQLATAEAAREIIKLYTEQHTACRELQDYNASCSQRYMSPRGITVDRGVRRLLLELQQY